MHERARALRDAVLLIMPSIPCLAQLLYLVHIRIHWLRKKEDYHHHPQTTRAESEKIYVARPAAMMASAENRSGIQPRRRAGSEKAENQSAKGGEGERAAPVQQQAEQAIDLMPEDAADEAEMERRRYGEAQPQLVPLDVIETKKLPDLDSGGGHGMRPKG